ncbi:GIY-YIG nuclease family protein [Streptomyces sp. NPDC052052]|uniref:GIY-YIG nuclease family protein n=1 Tax=Streptomyces sp. NPDC052052 TaxID=3154756 RepID=UPI0034149A0C
MSHRPNNEPTALYRLYDSNDALLYLGISWNPDARMEDHVKDKHWIHFVARRTVEWYPNRPAALAAEAAATAIEKPLHDSSWRKTRVGSRPQWRDLEGRKRVEDGLAAEIEQGQHWLGKVLMSGAVAKRYDVSRPTASTAMDALQGRGLLKRWHYGRFRVLKGPARKDLEEFDETRADRKLRWAYQIWTVAELREAVKGLPDDTLISARLSGQRVAIPGQRTEKPASGSAGSAAPF